MLWRARCGGWLRCGKRWSASRRGLEICRARSLEGLGVFYLGEICVDIAVSNVKEEKSDRVDRPDFIEKHHGSRPPYLPINCFQKSEGQ